MARKITEYPPQLIWAPEIDSHDPNPPLPLETSDGFEDATFSAAGVGAFNAFSNAGTPVEATWLSSGGGSFVAFGSPVVPVEATWLSSGSGMFMGFSGSATPVDAAWLSSGGSVASFFEDPPTESAFEAAGSSDVQFYGERAYVARCEDAYTYDPLGGPVWAGTLRRDPEIILQTQSNDSPSQSTFTDEDEPALGQNVQLDMQDGHGIMLGGTVQSYTTRYEGQPDTGTGPNDHIVHDVVVADYLWLLNKRRPFGCFTQVSASIVAQTLLDNFAPPDFSGAGIVPGLPAITVEFDGSLDFSGCMSVIASRIAGTFRVNRDKVLSLFQDDPAPGPQVIDDSNMLLIRDQPLTINHDASQLRNRVFVRGASAKLMADSAAGATQLEIDGLDIFDENGGEAIIGCDRFTYGSKQVTLVYPPPDASLTIGPTIESGQLIDPGNFYREGPIRTQVRYSSAYVFNGKEGPRSTPRETNVLMVNPTFGSGIEFIPFGGFIPAMYTVQWLFGYRTATGGILYDVNIGDTGSTFRFEPGAYRVTVNLGTFGNEERPSQVVLWRKVASLQDVDPGPPGTQNGWYFEVGSQPYVPGVSSYEFIDGKADASVGNPLPWDDGLYAYQRYYTIGSRVNVAMRSARFDAYNNGATGLKIYREEAYAGGSLWTSPEVVATFSTTSPPSAAEPVLTEDVKPTTAHYYAFGPEPNNDPGTTPPPPKPKERLILSNVQGLDEAHFEGDEVFIFMQLDDLPSQIAAAQREGGDGLHEFMVVDSGLRSDAELQVRGEAELTLFKDPITTVRYSTFDNTHTPGGTVEFNLTRPPLVASLKITEVKIDKVHYEHGHVARYNVTASSVKFTLQDLLRRTILRPY